MAILEINANKFVKAIVMFVLKEFVTNVGRRIT
jgi:hypothetical protein